MGRRSEHSREELQQLILDATLQLVNEHGADNVTARQIARAVGYTPGMLYSVFVNLQDIFLHVNSISIESLYQECLLASESTDEPVASMHAMGLAYLRYAEEHTHKFDLLFRRMMPITVEVPTALRSRINALFHLIECELRTLAPARSDHAVRIAARAVWSGVHGTAQLMLSEQLYLDSAHADREVVHVLIDRFVDSWQR
jgi:AcrR family transcriptional regulator